MRPIKLIMQAFGPYLKRQTVDFEELSREGLFLICGSTGSGKTAILDAISYALYGRSSGGGRGDLSTMRCSLAEDNESTLIEFTFASQGKLWRFSRSVEVKRARDGSISPNVSQTALRSDTSDENGRPIFVRACENNHLTTVRKLAESVVGLTWEQFRQVVILPQGQFESFLVAPSEDKEKILVSLLGADKWQETAAMMCEEAKEAADALKLRRASHESMLRSVGAESLDALSLLAADSLVKLEEHRKKAVELAASLEKSETEYAEAERLSTLYAELDAAEKRYAHLSSPETAVTVGALRKRAAAIAGAKAAYPALERAQNAAKELALRQTEAQKAFKLLDTAENVLAERERALNIIEEKYKNRSAVDEDHRRLLSLREVYSACADAQRELAVCKLKHDTAERELADAEDKLKRETELLKGLEADRDRIITEVVIILPELRERVKECERQKSDRAERDALKKRKSELTSELERERTLAEKLSAELEAALEHHKKVRGFFDASSAAALAETLEDGKPCPVCGSVDHPKKAEAAEAVTKEIVEKAAENVERIRKAQNEHTVKTERLTLVCEDIDAKLSKFENAEAPENAEDLDTMSAKALSELKTAERENDRLPGINKMLARSRENAAELAEKQAASVEARDTARTQYEVKTAAYKAAKERLDPEIPDLKTLDLRLSRLKSELETLDTAYDAARKSCDEARLKRKEAEALSQVSSEEYIKASAARADADSLAETELKRCGFETRDAYDRAALDASNENALTTAITAHENDLEEAKRRLSRAQSQTENTERPKLAELKTMLLSLRMTSREADSTLALAGSEYERLSKAYLECSETAERLKTDEAECIRRTAFAKALRGDSGIGLLRYVLGVSLSGITAEANRLLEDTLGGRYRLRRTLEGSGRTRKVGLELEAVDSYTGEGRPVSGLSGGEKFICSLALSLGLSAVVTRGAAGHGDDAVFIDEGFGTLDPSAVDDAMRMLTRIKGSRGTVGIISHVAALSAVIPSKLTVRASRNGSMIE